MPNGTAQSDDLRLAREMVLRTAKDVQDIIDLRSIQDLPKALTDDLKDVITDCSNESCLRLLTRLEAIGATSAGKSTLLNALMGARYNPTGKLSTTLPPVYFKHAPDVHGSADSYSVSVKLHNLVTFKHQLQSDLRKPPTVSDDGVRTMNPSAAAAYNSIQKMMPAHQKLDQRISTELVNSLFDELQSDPRLADHLSNDSWTDKQSEPAISFKGLSKEGVRSALAAYVELSGGKSVAPLVKEVHVEGPLPLSVPNVGYADTCGQGAETFTTGGQAQAAADTISMVVLDAEAISAHKGTTLATLEMLQDCQYAGQPTILVLNKVCSTDDSLPRALSKLKSNSDDVKGQLEVVAHLTGASLPELLDLAQKAGILSQRPRHTERWSPTPVDQNAYKALLRNVRWAARIQSKEELVDLLRTMPAYSGSTMCLVNTLAVFAVAGRDAMRIADPDGEAPEMFETLEETGILDVHRFLCRYQHDKHAAYLRQCVDTLEVVHEEISDRLQLPKASAVLDQTAVDTELGALTELFMDAVRAKVQQGHQTVQDTMHALAANAAARAPRTLRQEAARLDTPGPLKKHLAAHGQNSAYITRRSHNHLEPSFNRTLRKLLDAPIFSVKANDTRHFTNLVAGPTPTSPGYTAVVGVMVRHAASASQHCQLPADEHKAFMASARRTARTTIKKLHFFFRQLCDSLVTSMLGLQQWGGSAAQRIEESIMELCDPVYMHALEVTMRTHPNQVFPAMLARLHDGMEEQLDTDGEPTRAMYMYTKAADVYLEEMDMELLGLHDGNPILMHANQLLQGFKEATRADLVRRCTAASVEQNQAAASVESSLQILATAKETLAALKQQLAVDEPADPVSAGAASGSSASACPRANTEMAIAGEPPEAGPSTAGPADYLNDDALSSIPTADPETLAAEERQLWAALMSDDATAVAYDAVEGMADLTTVKSDKQVSIVQAMVHETRQNRATAVMARMHDINELASLHAIMSASTSENMTV